MNFLYPTFLFGLFSIAIPVIIHLFNLKRPREVLFTNVRFLRNVQQATSSKLKLKHYLVLFSRILFLIFLVLAFAQPIMEGKNPEMLKGSNNVGVYLDNSLSMENDIGETKAFDAAIKSLSNLKNLFSPSTNYLFLTNDFDSKDLYFKNKERFTERIAEVNYSPVSRSANQVVARQNSLLNNQDEEGNYLFWFSDFQKSTMGDLSSLKIDSLSRYYLIPLQNKEVANVYIDSLWLEEPLVKVNQTTVLKARVKNTGNKPASQLDLKLLLDNVQVSNTSINIAAGSTAITEFSFSVNDTLTKNGVVRVEDQPIRFDNDYYFVLDVSSKVSIYHIFDGSESNVSRVYNNEDIFDIESVSVGQVDYSRISNADLVVLENLDNITPALKDALVDFTRKSGSLVIFPGKNPSLKGYSGILKGVNINTYQADTSDKAAYYLDRPDFNNTFFKGVFEKEDKNIQMPYAFPVLKPSVAGLSIFKFKNELNFLSKFNTMGDGDLFIFSSPLLKEYSNFHFHALFVPVMYQIAFGSFKNKQRLAYSFQESVIPIEVGNVEKGAVYTLESGDIKLIPSQRLAGNILNVELPYEKMKSGFYNLKKGDRSVKSLAFNLASDESQMSFYSPEELKSIFGSDKNVQVFDVNNEEEFLSSFKNENIGTPLWKYCLILALIFLLTEILFIRFL